MLWRGTNVSAPFKPEKYAILSKVTVCFIWSPIAIAEYEQGSQQTWPNVT